MVASRLRRDFLQAALIVLKALPPGQNRNGSDWKIFSSIRINYSGWS